jgi:DNA repair protein RecO (recombination protein O)
MGAEKTWALVIRVVEWSESSCVVTLFTRDFGKVTAIAKGARRPKGPFESALDLLSLCRVVSLRKSSEALDLLTEAKLEKRFRPGKGGLPWLYAGYYVAELLNELTTEYDAHVELFDTAEESLRRLETTEDFRHVVLRFELAALRVLGHLPSLEICVECGVAVPPVGRVPFGPLVGGVLCAKCRAGQRQIVTLSGEALSVLQTLSHPESDPVELTPKIAGEVRGLLSGYLAHLLGHSLKMHDLLASSWNIRKASK